MNNLINQNPQNPQILQNVQNSQINTNTNGSNSEIQEFFNYLNIQNNMNLKKIILFYSKYSKLCEQFVHSLHPNYKVLLNMISVDNSVIRKRLMNSKYKLQYVPCIFMLFEDGKVNIHYGNELISLVAFLNKNMEAFMVIKTNENLSKRKLPSQGRTQLIQPQQKNNHNNHNEQMSNMLEESSMEQMSQISQMGQMNQMSQMDEILDPRAVTKINIQTKKENKLKMKNIPRVKQPIPEDFKRDMDVGISSRRMIPKGRKEHKKMAQSSLTVLESNKQLETIEEEEETSDEEEDINIEMEDAEILDNILEEEDDKTIDPILMKVDKNKIKEIAAEMAKERGPVDDKKYV
jgi:hypothetical protein